MKRDMDLVIRILKSIEERTEDEFGLELHYPDLNDELVQYHVNMMIDAGLIDGRCQMTSDGRVCFINGLTWYGHDFLESAKNETVVNKAKDFVKSKGMEFSSLPFDVAKDVLMISLKSLLGI